MVAGIWFAGLRGVVWWRLGCLGQRNAGLFLMCLTSKFLAGLELGSFWRLTNFMTTCGTKD